MDDLKNSRSPKCVANMPSGSMCGVSFEQSSELDETDKDATDPEELEEEMRELLDSVTCAISERDKMLERLIQNSVDSRTAISSGSTQQTDFAMVFVEIEAISKSL
jgi:hypothetical protein